MMDEPITWGHLLVFVVAYYGTVLGLRLLGFLLSHPE
jgi:hypothetical protein